MKLIRENYVFILGWVVRVGLAQLLSVFSKILLFGLSYFSEQSTLPLEITTTLFVIVPTVFTVINEYASFWVSARGVVVPLFFRKNDFANKPKQDFMFLEWLKFAVLSLIYNLPIFSIALFPNLIPMTKGTQDILSFVWKFVVGFIAYQSIISQYIVRLTKAPKNGDANQSTVLGEGNRPSQTKKFSLGFIIFATVLIFSIGYVVTGIVLNNYRQNIIDKNSHLLFCETLKSGMSISEVTDILNSKGNVIIRVANESAHSTHYSILFTDEKEQDLYGGWTELDFVEGKYARAYIVGFDYAEEICNLGLAPQK